MRAPAHMMTLHFFTERKYKKKIKKPSLPLPFKKGRGFILSTLIRKHIKHCQNSSLLMKGSTPIGGMGYKNLNIQYI